MHFPLVIGLTLLTGAASFIGMRVGDAILGDSDESRFIFVATAYLLSCAAICALFDWYTLRRVFGLSLASLGAVVVGVCLNYGTQVWDQRASYSGGWMMILLGPGLSIGIVGGFAAVMAGALLLFVPRLFAPSRRQSKGVANSPPTSSRAP